MKQANSFTGLNMDKTLLKQIVCPSLHQLRLHIIHNYQVSWPLSIFPINNSKTCIPEMMIDIPIFCRGQEGKFRDSSHQFCQIWLLPGGTDFPSSPLFKGLSKCLTAGELCRGAESTEMERKEVKTWAGLCRER